MSTSYVALLYSAWPYHGKLMLYQTASNNTAKNNVYVQQCKTDN